MYKPEDYPHTCNICGSAAYLGLQTLCTNMECEKFDPELKSAIYDDEDDNKKTPEARHLRDDAGMYYDEDGNLVQEHTYIDEDGNYVQHSKILSGPERCLVLHDVPYGADIRLDAQVGGQSWLGVKGGECRLELNGSLFPSGSTAKLEVIYPLAKYKPLELAFYSNTMGEIHIYVGEMLIDPLHDEPVKWQGTVVAHLPPGDYKLTLTVDDGRCEHASGSSEKRHEVRLEGLGVLIGSTAKVGLELTTRLNTTINYDPQTIKFDSDIAEICVYTRGTYSTEEGSAGTLLLAKEEGVYVDHKHPLNVESPKDGQTWLDPSTGIVHIWCKIEERWIQMPVTHDNSYPYMVEAVAPPGLSDVKVSERIKTLLTHYPGAWEAFEEGVKHSKALHAAYEQWDAPMDAEQVAEARRKLAAGEFHTSYDKTTTRTTGKTRWSTEKCPEHGLLKCPGCYPKITGKDLSNAWVKPGDVVTEGGIQYRRMGNGWVVVA